MSLKCEWSLLLFLFAGVSLLEVSEQHVRLSVNPYAAMGPQADEILRQNNFIDWIISIFTPPQRPDTTTTTTSSTSTSTSTSTTQRPTSTTEQSYEWEEPGSESEEPSEPENQLELEESSGPENYLEPERECGTNCRCGQINTFKRIVGGMETEVHQYPWMAMLMKNNRLFCGGSLISDLYVLTAAHCLDKETAPQINVRLLEHDRTNSNPQVIDRRAAALIQHERWNPDTFDNDVALIRMVRTVNLEDNGLLRPVCMPTAGQNYDGQTAIITGWGAIGEDGPTSDTLQEVSIPILMNERCRRLYDDFVPITKNMLCAGIEEGGIDSCQGDSGGPLHVVRRGSNEYQLAGVVSFGDGCARPNRPGVYARVTRYMNWIARRTLDSCTCQPEGNAFYESKHN